MRNNDDAATVGNATWLERNWHCQRDEIERQKIAVGKYIDAIDRHADKRENAEAKLELAEERLVKAYDKIEDLTRTVHFLESDIIDQHQHYQQAIALLNQELACLRGAD